jgi:hypothetical protein
MTDDLGRYLNDSYRRDVMGESVKVETPAAEPGLIERVRATLASIDALRLGANLINRDFVAAQHKRALERLLRELEQQESRGDASQS